MTMVDKTKGFVKKYSSASIRLGIYITLAVLATVSSELAGLTEFSEMSTLDWFRLCLGSIIAGLTVWRAFIDKTMARVDGEISTTTHISFESGGTPKKLGPPKPGAPKPGH